MLNKKNKQKKENEINKNVNKNTKIILTLIICLTSITIFTILSSQFTSASQVLTDKNNYRLSETVNIELSNIIGNEELQIYSESGFLKFSGDLQTKIPFRPREIGEYTLRLLSQSNVVLSETKFNVTKDASIKTNLLKTDKKEYLPGEKVVITIDNYYEDNLQLNIISDDSYKYLGKLDKEIIFSPNKIGKYTLELKKDFIAIATTDFEVKNTIKTFSIDANNQQINISEKNNLTHQINSNNTTAISIDDEQNNLSSTININNEILEQKIDQIKNEDINETEQEIKLPFKLQTKNKKNNIHEDTIEEYIQTDSKNQKYEVKIKPNIKSINEIKFNDLKVDKDLSFDLDEIQIKKEEIKKYMKNKNSIKSFFIDTSNLNYTNGTITSIAAGSELWKCKLWNKTTSSCDGTWDKIMNLQPGQEYNINIYPEDPGYTETGVASINTKKSIYHPGDTAEIIIVILNNKGYLVNNAQISLTITDPNNLSTTLTTNSGQIIQTNNGIYELNYSTTTEGIYEMLVSATGLNVNSAMYSTFEAKNSYEFDIIRQTPVTIDPWQGPFESIITINPNINISNYDFVEILPSNFIVTDSGGANIDTIGNNTFLTWTGLTSESKVKYLAQAPLITPDLYSLGKSFITYFDGINKIFTEARKWLLAIDPINQLFFEDFENNWGCSTTGTTIIGNCSSTPWGNFNFCDDNGGDYLFCTTDDGQETDTHSTFGIEMVDWDTWNESRGICYYFNPAPYDDVEVSGYSVASGIDAGEFCRSWVKDSNNWDTIYQCNNGDACEVADTTPQGSNYVYFERNISSFPGINLSETNISICIGADMSATSDRCFFDRINVTTIAFPPNVTNLTYPINNSIVNISKITFNFTVNDTKDPFIPNCTLWANFNGTWLPNTTIYDVSKTIINNITITVDDGNYIWNIECIDSANLAAWYITNFTFTIDAQPPRKTIIDVDTDYLEPYTTINRNPFINVSLNKNASCRFSFSNETYAQMSDDYYCVGNNTKNANCTYPGTPLTVGENNFYIACNDTSNHADNTSINKLITIDVLCDSHSDCDASQYCDTTQHCSTDILPGYNCNGITYTGLTRNETCGDGNNAYCVNDSTYIFTGWYCTDSQTDCVYNDNGNSYDINYRLCNETTNDYKTCSVSNQWSAWTLCADQFDSADQAATTHTGQYCAYYASEQSCSNGTSGGCSGSPTDCGNYIYNTTTLSCGSTLNDCDLGCGAVCDTTNNTNPGIISNVCYFDKSCSNACGWAESTEIAPNFCINDNDGGSCAFTTRTNPNITDTCYWNPTCTNGTGATLTLGANNNLRLDYCDYCNATGNQTGQYSPAPNASCSSNCANAGVIYYDNGTTPNDRNDDCNIGTSRILNDTLTFGDIWNGSGPAFCEDAECNLDCGTYVGTCNLGVCGCSDQDAPTITLINPINNTWTNNGTIIFRYNVTDISSSIFNCTLILNGTSLQTNTTINTSLNNQTFNRSLVNGTYNWSIRCIDNSTNKNINTTINWTFGVDTVRPNLTNPRVNGTNFTVSTSICINITAVDAFSGINTVTAEIRIPGQPAENITLSDSVALGCDPVNGNNVYSALYTMIFNGTFNWSNAYATDLAGNINTTRVGLLWNVSARALLNSTINQPTTNIRINESEFNFKYIQNCTASCLTAGQENCTNTMIFLEYKLSTNSTFVPLNTTSIELFSNINNFSCGNLSRGQNCTTVFNITSGANSGNNTYTVRCGAQAINAATKLSLQRNITVNKKPTPNFFSPVNQTWLAFVKIINTSTSFDSDGNITNRTLQYDNNTNFASPSTICSTNQSNCTWNTTVQNQCLNNSMSCYLRLTLIDNFGLNNSAYITVGFDTQGPITTLDLQRSFANITTNTIIINASVIDNEVGNISRLIFEYRTNSTNNWINICNNSNTPYNCTWNVTNLVDSSTYQLRAYANDSLGNTGAADNHTNITIDRVGPYITLLSPTPQTFLNVTTINFQFNANDTTSTINNCSVYIDGLEKNSSTTISETSQNTIVFGTLTEGYHNWSVKCFDSQNIQNSSLLRNFTIDTTGPVTTLDLPKSFANITGGNVNVNASSIDSSVGNVSQTIFEYRQNNTANWIQICSDSSGPIYNCSWNTIGLADARTYEIRAWSNDTLQNNGSFSTHTNITIDNNPPNITLVSPANETTDGNGNVIFSYFVNNEISLIKNCSLIINNIINQTQNPTINVGQIYSFTINNMTNGQYNWTVRCTDSNNLIGTGYEGQRSLLVDIQFIMKINVTTNSNTYELGNQIGPIINVTNNITDPFNQSLSNVLTTTDFILITNKSEQVPGWWNTSWQKRKAIYLSSNSANNMTNISIVINITELNGNITNCANEIRIADTKNNLIASDIIDGDNTNYCEIKFLGSISSNAVNENKYFVYYNNSGSSSSNPANIANTTYPIFFEDFEGGGWTQIASNNPITQCAGGFGNFNGCIDFTTSMDFSTTTATGAPISGTRILTFDQSNPFAADQGIYYNFSALNSCGGDQCEDIIVSGYIAASSLDNAGEYAIVWARNDTSTTFTTIYQCQDGTSCEFSTGDVAPSILSNWTYFSQRLKENLSLGFTNQMFVHIALVGSQAADNAFFEDINITGVRKQAPNITNAFVGTSQLWIERNTNLTGVNGISKSIMQTINKTFANYSITTFGQKTNYSLTYNFTFIEIKKDFTPPVIALNSPPNRSESNSSVTFTYIVNDTLSTVLNCSLFIDNISQSTNSIIQEGPVQFFFPRIPSGGWHNWSVKCFDFYNNMGTSDAWEIYISPPDLFVNDSDIKFNKSNPKEGENVTINATIYNLGGSDAINATVQFYLDDPDLGGIQIGQNITIPILNDQSGSLSNVTLNVSWIVTGPGPFYFYVVLDPPLSTNGSLFELYENNNKANNTLNVPAYQYFYGNVSTNIFLGNITNQSSFFFNFYLNATNVTGNIFVTSQSSVLSFSNLQALGRNTSNTTAFNDFIELDSALNMTKFNDSNSKIFTNLTGTPFKTKNMTIFKKNITNVAIINSTNTTNFVTGILWDTSDGGVEYNGTQDVAYVTNINYKLPGKFGTYDYEIKVPAPLENYKASSGIAFYWEINT